jgi:U2 small nuclear ribonucleoprotein B''
MASAIAAPNNTLYVKNVDWKVKKPLLKRALFSLFTRHGKVRQQRVVNTATRIHSFIHSFILPLTDLLTYRIVSFVPFIQVLEIIALRREGLRGQAWVVFDDVQAATAAIQAEQGFPFFGKDLQLAYASDTSDRIAKRNGTYVPKAKRKKVEKPTSAEAAAAAAKAAAEQVVPPPPPGGSETAQAQPSHILFAQDLPTECNEMMLAMLFRQYAGFKEVRIPREGLGFVEFDDEPHATLALERLNGFKLTTTDTLKLTYGKS